MQIPNENRHTHTHIIELIPVTLHGSSTHPDHVYKWDRKIMNFVDI